MSATTATTTAPKKTSRRGTSGSSRKVEPIYYLFL